MQKWKIINFLILMVLTVNVVKGQNNPLIKAFKPLLGKSWYAEGEWGDGSKFKQKVSFESGLEGTIVKALSEGYINEQRTKWGQRNHGVRTYDEECQCFKFWEFDVFGGQTTGQLDIRSDTFLYHYKYGGSDLTDAWIKVADFKYKFIVGEWDNKKWKQKYLETYFVVQPELTGDRDEIDQIMNQSRLFSETYMEEDHVKLSHFYTTMGKIMPGGSAIIKGRQDIADRWQLPEGAQIHSHKSYPESIEVIGDTAIDYGYYEGSSQNAGKEIVNWKGKYVIIWKKVEGDWLMDIDIWNRVN